MFSNWGDALLVVSARATGFERVVWSRREPFAKALAQLLVAGAVTFSRRAVSRNDTPPSVYKIPRARRTRPCGRLR